MIAMRAGSGWQTVLADLSIILFMITAAAVSDAPAQSPPRPAAAEPQLPALAEPVAVWGVGGPPLRQWLAAAAGDPRLRLTILAAPEASDAALALAGEAGRPARIILDPDLRGPPLAMLGYDQAGLAQPLQNVSQKPPAKEPIP